MREKAANVVEAADRVLTLMEILRRDGILHINAAARELGVAPSTVHRLVQTLVFRGYAVQSLDRTYAPGPAIPRGGPGTDWAGLVGRWHSVLEDVARAAGETVHLVVRDGDSALFLDSVVGAQALSVASRAGRQLPAERNSAGKILLAHMPTESLLPLYAQRSDIDFEALQSRLESVRRQGFGLSIAESERGITAIGVRLNDSGDTPVAVAVSGPSMRFDRRRALAVLPVLHRLATIA
ncbi:IclR family transcriptional regulator [Mycolicibacterium sp.]|uniref:IclR family transcriptional regulator n=1 Tax=Mycolicibacterium sp. TaxID=2320850 RepID=UPI003D12062C